jgi:iron complex outermembrane receptor protein
VNNPVTGAPITARHVPTRSTTTTRNLPDRLYIQDQMALDNWRLTLGGRQDWVKTGTHFIKDDTDNSQLNRKFSGNAAISYVFDSGFVPYLSYAESFQPTSKADVTRPARSSQPKASSGSWASSTSHPAPTPC